MTQFTCPKAVTHLSTNRARCRATALIETNALPLHQTANPGVILQARNYLVMLQYTFRSLGIPLLSLSKVSSQGYARVRLSDIKTETLDSVTETKTEEFVNPRRDQVRRLNGSRDRDVETETTSRLIGPVQRTGSVS